MRGCSATFADCANAALRAVELVSEVANSRSSMPAHRRLQLVAHESAVTERPPAPVLSADIVPYSAFSCSTAAMLLADMPPTRARPSPRSARLPGQRSRSKRPDAQPYLPAVKPTR
ncbi:hypothetical protein I551_8629 [Mycobacterium ulcerans str. Harvey]|uniref:Uncharacterized protein n=1 Tax=Mycobacterium ulcerans str. Harvey TaxID=1299332 RepID=A0ABP3AVA8_MYCUL|nr:hypothetical protein I551_8629 [Mycobacterium ulcerans str. Harvey]